MPILKTRAIYVREKRENGWRYRNITKKGTRNAQSDRGDLARQSQTRHLRPDALSQQSCVELLKGTGFARGHDRRPFKQILQIVIVILIQTANGDLFLRSLQLPVDTTVIGAALCLDAKTAVRPQLPLGAETMWGLQNAEQYG